MKVNWEVLKDVGLKWFVEFILFFNMVGYMIVPCILTEWFPILQVLWFMICVPLVGLCLVLYLWVRLDGEPLF